MPSSSSRACGPELQAFCLRIADGSWRMPFSWSDHSDGNQHLSGHGETHASDGGGISMKFHLLRACQKETVMARTAFLGLGVMGFHMAGHLARAGHQVSVWNRTAAKSAAWTGVHRGEAAKDPASAVFGAEFVLMCLGDDPDVRAVFDQFESSLGAGMTVIDHTTASAGLARELAARCKAKGARFIDAPVSGGEAGAINGKLTIMCGGEPAAFAAAEPVMNAFARKITLIGDTGAGQLAKSVNQICIAGIVQGLAEGLHFAERAGLDPAEVYEAISKGAAQSWQLDNRWKTMRSEE